MQRERKMKKIYEEHILILLFLKIPKKNDKFNYVDSRKLPKKEH